VPRTTPTPVIIAGDVIVGELTVERSACRLDSLGQPEVEYLDMAVLGQGDVRGLEVPMDDSFFVRGFECLRDLLSDRERLIDGDRPMCNALVQALTVNELEHEELRAVGFFEAVNLGDVRMIE
jgi:hypothetical protein